MKFVLFLIPVLLLLTFCKKPEEKKHFVISDNVFYRAGLSISSEGQISKMTLSRNKIEISEEKERNPQISEQHLVIIAYDIDNKEIWRKTIKNPGLVQGHDYGDTLSGQKVEMQPVENFSLYIPALPDLNKIEVYKPVLNGNEYELIRLGSKSAEP